MTNSAPSIANWLNYLADGHRLSRKSQVVVHTLARNPRLASYGSIRELAERSNVSVSAVTRTAQALGFKGWPALQEELRARYITSITLKEFAEQRPVTTSTPSVTSLAYDRDNLSTFLRTASAEQLKRVAQRIAESRRTFVISSGSFLGIGQTLSHLGTLNGYDVRLLTESYQVPNTLAASTPDDLMIIISFWRLHESAYHTIQSCADRDIPFVLLTDNVPLEIEERCAECIRIPTEGTGFSPSLTVASAAIYAIIAELYALNPELSNRMAEEAEREWERFGLQHRY